MEKKGRYCADCGCKTNEHTCPICDRNTKPISAYHRDGDLCLLEDDIQEDETTNDFTGDQGHKESRQHYYEQRQRSKRKINPGEHPYYETGKKNGNQMNFEPDVKIVQIVGGVIFVVVIIIAVFSSIRTQTDMSTLPEGNAVIEWEHGSYFGDLIETSEASNVRCTLEKKDGVLYARLINPSPYFVSILLEEEYAINVENDGILQPFSQQDKRVLDAGSIKECNVYEVQSYEFTSPTTTLEYQLLYVPFSTRNTVDVVLKENGTVDEISDFAKYLYTGMIEASDIRITEINIYIGKQVEENLIYKVYMDYDNNTIDFESANDNIPIKSVSLNPN